MLSTAASYAVAEDRSDAGADHAGGVVVRQALAHILAEVAATDYRFTVPTPLTHHRYLASHAGIAATSLREVFGWNLPFMPTILSPGLLDAMHTAGVLHPAGALARAGLRVASLGNDLFLHSGYPTTQEDAVFFGPDTYRFARFIDQHLLPPPLSPPSAMDQATPMRILDIGCGSGAGGIAALRAAQRMGLSASRINLLMNDINPLALRFTKVNAAQAGVSIGTACGDALAAVEGSFDLIVCNPPYMDDGSQRAYRHGGTGLGRALSLRIAGEALARLAPGGRLLLYSGVAIVDGHDALHEELLALLARHDCDGSYGEIDPDVFGEELERPEYARAERIAAVGLAATRRHRL